MYTVREEEANLVPEAFPLKIGWDHPFFKGNALGTRLGGSYLEWTEWTL